MQLASQGANVISIDRSAPRLKRLSENLARTNLTADVVVSDAAKFRTVKKVDHILLDAPCSATGTLRRNPDVIWTKTQADVEKLANLQARLLDHAFDLLPVGGTLVYCVCSLETQEGIEQIRSFLGHVTNAARKPITPEDVGGLSSLITDDGDLLCLPSDPALEGGMDGFFAARIVKN
ncbi:MAG: hypothetical protein JKY60_01960 [Kordiimonadaceae bacterium]|nr:hypothetical protein [Kordiimonadaceae bacterium]